MIQQNDIDNMFESDSTSSQSAMAELAEHIAREDYALEAMKKELTRRTAELDAAKNQLADMLLAAGLSSIKLESGLAPKVMPFKKYFKAAGISDDLMFDWLNNNNLGAIIKPYVHWQTLQGTLKQYEETGGELPETVFNVTEGNTVRMNGKSKFLAAQGVVSEANE